MTKKNLHLELDISERMVPEFHKGHTIYGEHIVRYEAASQLANQKVVLDIASGSGYGTKLLSKSAKKVYGVDISEESITYSKKNFDAKNIEYLIGSGEKIPLKNNTVDLVVSFETIEHIEDYKTFMKELVRVLKPDGLLVLSTPNETEFAEGNHYHVHEFQETELTSLIKKHFKFTHMYYQGDWVYSGLFQGELMSKLQTPTKVRTMQLAPLNKGQYLYFYALCANRKITEEIEPLAAMSQHWSAREIQEASEETQAYIDNVSSVLKSHKEHVKFLEKSVKLKDNHIKNLERQLSRYQNILPIKLIRKSRRILRSD